MPQTKEQMLARWRLVLGEDAESQGIGTGGVPEFDRVEKLIGFLFKPAGDGEGGKRPPKDRQGGSGASQLTVPEWVDQVKELFPQEVKEVMERELINRRGIRDLMEKP
jgi:hypothetical protein